MAIQIEEIVLHQLHIWDFLRMPRGNKDIRKIKWQCRLNADLNPTCASSHLFSAKHDLNKTVLYSWPREAYRPRPPPGHDCRHFFSGIFSQNTTKDANDTEEEIAHRRPCYFWNLNSRSKGIVCLMPPSAWPVNYKIWGSQGEREYCSTWSQNIY